MLSQEILDLCAQNRKNQKTLIPLPDLKQKIPLTQYENLIEVTLELCDALQLHSTTKYLARCYLDKMILAYPSFDEFKSYLKIAIACISVAMKLDQTQRHSFNFPTQYLFLQAELDVTEEECTQIVQAVMIVCQLKLKFTCPLEYQENFFFYLPRLMKMKEQLQMVVQMAMTEPEICNKTAEQIFLASVLSIIEYKNMRLKQLELIILKSMSGDWNEIMQLKVLILAHLQNQQFQ